MAGYQLERIMSGISDSVKRGTGRALEELAPQFLRETVTKEAAFNNYTGNLEEAYVAMVFANGALRNVFYHKTSKKHKVRTGPKGGRRVLLVSPPRHPIYAMRKNPDYGGIGEHKRERYEKNVKTHNIYRYIKKIEHESGYWNIAKQIAKARRDYGMSTTSDRGVTSGPANRSGSSRSLIRIINVAPYAGYVQYRKKGKRYNVIRGAEVESWRRKGARLVKDAILKDLKANGFRQPNFRYMKDSAGNYMLRDDGSRIKQEFKRGRFR